MARDCTSGKVQHTSSGRAAVAAREYARRLNREGVIAETMYAYRCAECGKWHLTRQSGWESNALVFQAPPEDLQRWAMTGER